ncbi:MAG: hypothetical protein DRR08_13075 [Candidatus Parabeggiatoa sp. nov. 2]|nr:MAG: hypothetical protein DRR08_13075 [Gammaproteobacteria bacterium]
MEIERIDVSSLKEMDSNLTRETCDFFSQAASVCLDNQNHSPGVKFKVEGDLSAEFQLFWKPVTQQMKDSCYDLQYATEAGAYCLAILMIQKLTDYKVIRQSQKGTGFDFWLGAKGDDYPFKNKARLEISGILKGNQNLINQRVSQKTDQTKPSDGLKLPAYIAVVEFGTPILKVVKK